LCVPLSLNKLNANFEELYNNKNREQLLLKMINQCGV
jgi:hypothetical protein